MKEPHKIANIMAFITSLETSQKPLRPAKIAVDIRIIAKTERNFNLLFLVFETIGAEGDATGASRLTVAKDVNIAAAIKESLYWTFSLDNTIASSAMAGKSSIVTRAHRTGELECTPPAVCLRKATVNRLATVPGSTPSNQPNASVANTLHMLMVNISII